MQPPVQNEVFDTLSSLHETFAEIVYGAWDDWLTVYAVKPILCPRARANVVWSYMADRARQAFGEHPSVRISEGSGTVSFIAFGRVLFRFKKGDERGLSRNYPTPQALSFHDHEKSLFGPLNPDRVEVVYVLNTFETQVNRVMVVARVGDTILWAYDIEEAHGAKIAELPITRPDSSSEAPLWQYDLEDQANKDAKHEKDTE